ncbi:MAG: hypothetical protein JW891_11790 [Candidatus Lokiarchaeota archaeon]|nr:hypothetical protein [Candidatus Lokiarchaeota archaeon]
MSEDQDKNILDEFGDEKFAEETSKKYLDYEQSYNAHFKEKSALEDYPYPTEESAKNKMETDFEKSFESHFY